MAKLLKGHGKWMVVVNKDARDKMNGWLGPNVNPEIIIGRKHYAVMETTAQKDLATLHAVSEAARIGWWIGKTQDPKDEAFPLIDVRVVKNEMQPGFLVAKP